MILPLVLAHHFEFHLMPVAIHHDLTRLKWWLRMVKAEITAEYGGSSKNWVPQNLMLEEKYKFP
jgi:hypothetical protein